MDTSGGSSSHQTLLETNEKFTRRDRRLPPICTHSRANIQPKTIFHPFAEAEQRFHPPSPEARANRIITTSPRPTSRLSIRIGQPAIRIEYPLVRVAHSEESHSASQPVDRQTDRQTRTIHAPHTQAREEEEETATDLLIPSIHRAKSPQSIKRERNKHHMPTTGPLPPSIARAKGIESAE